MKPLVYTTAFGDDTYYRLAAAMFRSLRLRGYAGDACLLCDREPGLPAALGVEPVRVDLSRHSLVKARLAALKDISGHDRILFVDSDVVFLRSPEPLFALASERPAISRDHLPLSRNAFNRAFLSPGAFPMERLAGIRSINSGVIAFPGALFEERCRRWIEAWESPAAREAAGRFAFGEAELRDQPVLQKLICEGAWECAYIPDALLLMPLQYSERHPLHPDAVLLHLNGLLRDPARKARLLERMHEINALSTFAEFKDACARMQARARRFHVPLIPPPPTHAFPQGENP